MYKGTGLDIGKVGRELGVRYVLEGSVRRAGNRVRVTAQLIDATTSHHLWRIATTGNWRMFFSIQDEIGRNITGATGLGIIAAEIQQAQRKNPNQLDAWDRTVRAHWHIRRFTSEDLAEARRLLSESCLAGPVNSMAYADLAFARHFEAVFGGAMDRSSRITVSAMPRARRSLPTMAMRWRIRRWRSLNYFSGGTQTRDAALVAPCLSIQF